MADFSILQNIYWRIRFQRRKNLRLKYYYQAAAEKKRLLDAGVDPEELLLICRTLAKQHCEHAESRLKTYRTIMTKDPIFSAICDDGNCQ